MTLTDLYEKTLQRLTVVAAGESAQPEDTALVRDKYTGLYAQLQGKSLVSWALDENVPDYAALPIVSMLAAVSAPEFGIDPAKFTAEGALDIPGGSLAERQLRVQLASNYISSPAQSDYF